MSLKKMFFIKIVFACLLLLNLIVAQQQTENQQQKLEKEGPKINQQEQMFKTSLQLPDFITKGKCLEQHPYFAVGDIVLQDNNFQKTIRKNKFLVVIATAGFCYGCCKQELFYYNLYHHYLKNKQINPLADQIVVARYELATGKDFANEYPIKRFPHLVIFREGQPYYYNDIFDYARIMRFIRRIQQPLQTLDTLEQLENFLNRQEKDYDGNPINTVKVVGFFFDPEETEEDQKEFFRAAEKTLEKTEIYFGMMTNPKEIRKVKKKYSDKFFADDITLSGCVIQHFVGKYTIVDISDLVLNMRRISEFIQENSFKLVEELTLINYKYYEAKNKPIMVFVIDTIIKWEFAKKFLRTVEEVAKEYFDVLKFVYVEGELNAEKKKMLGINHKVVPAMAFFRLDYSNKVSWPSDWPINQVTIREFANDYLNKHIEYVIEKYERDVKKLKKSKIYAYLQNTIELKEESFNQYLHSKNNNDIAVLFLNSRQHLSEISIALNFNHISKRFKDFEINSVEICLYDTFYNQIPDFIKESHEKPFIVIFKANSNRNEYTLYEGEPKAEKLMQYLEQISGGRYMLPDLPHISEDMLDDYLTLQANQDNFDEDQFLMPKEDL